MPDARWLALETLFHGALEQPEASRSAWIAAHSGSDVGLAAEVERLLRSDASAGTFLADAVSVPIPATFTSDVDDLIGRRLGGYQVLELVGAGGMGIVYRARDLRLGRDVALKVFDRREAPDVVARLEAEARAASILSHPNIVTIYGVGEDGDLAFIAMELVAGRTLRTRLDEDSVDWRQALDIAIQLAEGVAAAHAAGIVHRDLKPENVMVAPDGRTRVLDFGIAVPAGSTASDPRGAIRVEGTVGYMSPEQARGEPAGPASDQFSLGVIVYEMATGVRLFARPTRQETRAAIAAVNPAVDLPRTAGLGPFDPIVRRCLARDPSARYPDCAALARELSRVRDRLEQGGQGMTRRRALWLGAAASVAAAAGVAGWRLGPGRPAFTSLAVLPFDNPEQDDRIAYLCDGLTETLIDELSRVPSLRVIARATAFTFRGRAVDPRDSGQRLGVDRILTGALTRVAGSLRISSELTDVRSGVRLWGESFDRPLVDALAVQQRIADAIREKIGVRLPDGQAATPATDPVAYDLFLQGVHQFRQTTELGYLQARAYFEQAIARAPDFALALVTLASTYSVMAIDGYESPAGTWPKADGYIRRAMRADPALPDAYAEAAISALRFRWDWQECDRLWTRALGLRRVVQSELLDACALTRWAAGNASAALDMVHSAREVDPLSVLALVREADLLAALDRLDDARTAYERVARDYPDDSRALFGLSDVLARQRRFDDATVALAQALRLEGDEDEAPRPDPAAGEAGYSLLVQTTVRHELERLDVRDDAGGFVSPLDYARAHARLGDRVRALQQLAAAVDARAPGVVMMGVDRVWLPFHDEPAFRTLAARVGIPRLTAASFGDLPAPAAGDRVVWEASTCDNV